MFHPARMEDVNPGEVSQIRNGRRIEDQPKFLSDHLKRRDGNLAPAWDPTKRAQFLLGISCIGKHSNAISYLRSWNGVYVQTYRIQRQHVNRKYLVQSQFIFYWWLYYFVLISRLKFCLNLVLNTFHDNVLWNRPCYLSV